MLIYPGKWIFLATPHTASTALSSAIEHSMGDTVHKNWVPAPRQSNRGHHHFGMEDLAKHPEIQKKLIGGEETWSVHRNPYDLAVTWWLRYMADGRVQGGPLDVPLADFIKRFAKLPVVVGGEIFWHKPDVWLKYEHLEAEVNYFLKSHHCPGIKLEVQNTTDKKRPWATYYEEFPEAITAMNERFGAEIEKFGYKLLTAP